MSKKNKRVSDLELHLQLMVQHGMLHRRLAQECLEMLEEKYPKMQKGAAKLQRLIDALDERTNMEKLLLKIRELEEREGSNSAVEATRTALRADGSNSSGAEAAAALAAGATALKAARDAVVD